jgi:hypothetical protein
MHGKTYQRSIVFAERTVAFRSAEYIATAGETLLDFAFIE